MTAVYDIPTPNSRAAMPETDDAFEARLAEAIERSPAVRAAIMRVVDSVQSRRARHGLAELRLKITERKGKR